LIKVIIQSLKISLDETIAKKNAASTETTSEKYSIIYLIVVITMFRAFLFVWYLCYAPTFNILFPHMNAFL